MTKDLTQTFDDWYQEMIRVGMIKQPNREAHKMLHSYWRQIEASGDNPTTGKMIDLMIMKPLNRAIEEFSRLADSFRAAPRCYPPASFLF